MYLHYLGKLTGEIILSIAATGNAWISKSLSDHEKRRDHWKSVT